MQKFSRNPLELGVGYPIIGVNSAQLSRVDGVYIDSSGFLALATTSSKILGFSLEDITMASSNQTVAKVKPKYTPALGVQIIVNSDIDCVQTDIGAYADYGTITTGVQVINLLAGTSGQFLVLGFDPYEEADLDLVVVEVAEPQFLAFAQA